MWRNSLQKQKPKETVVVVLTERLLVELPGPSADAVSVNAELSHHTSIAEKA